MLAIFNLLIEKFESTKSCKERRGRRRKKRKKERKKDGAREGRDRRREQRGREREREEVGERKESKRGCWLRVDKPRETRAPLRTASTWRSVSPIPLFLRSLSQPQREETSESLLVSPSRFDRARVLSFLSRASRPESSEKRKKKRKWSRGIDERRDSWPRDSTNARVCACARVLRVHYVSITRVLSCKS